MADALIVTPQVVASITTERDLEAVVARQAVSVITATPLSPSVIKVGTTRTVLLTMGLQGPGGPRGPAGQAGSTEEDMPYSRRTDFYSDTVIFRGEAVVGAGEADPVWRIRKLAFAQDGDVTETWAGGDAEFDKVWADRAALSYT